ncbi:MAG: DUF3127 domain-containing protein [Bacteroidales bacterium]|nr:DUF3127 domain-containing protein [Bacteroidales bacterium]
MAALELQCKLTRKLAVQSGQSQRGTWSKQDFIVEYQDGKFPVQICMNVWGDEKVREFENFQVGDRLRIAFVPSSREFNGKWYTDIRAYRIERADAPVQQPNAPAQAYAQAPQDPSSQEVLYSRVRVASAQSQAPAPSFNDMPAEPDDDDLPF